MKVGLILAASLALTTSVMAQQTFEPENVVKSCNVERNNFVAETVGLYQGNGQMGCTYAPLGLHWHTDYTNKYGETKLMNLNHSVRARYHHDYLVPLLQVYWNDFPTPTSATGISNYEQSQDFYDGTVSTHFTAKGITYNVKTWFDPVEPNLGFININASKSGTRITVDPMDSPRGHYGQTMVQKVSLAKDGRDTYKVTINCVQWQQDGTHDCDVPHSSDVYVTTNAKMSIKDNNIVVTLAKGDNYLRLSYGKSSNVSSTTSLDETGKWWHDKWNSQGMISVTDKTAEDMWVRSMAMFLSSYDDRNNGLCPPLSYTGTNWSFYFSQDVSYVHPILLSTGNLSIAKSWIEQWAKDLDGQRDYTKRIYKQNGVMIPWVYPYNGFDGYHKDGFPMHTFGQIHQGAYYVRMALQTANMIQDENWTSKYAIPILKGVAEFYSNIATKHADGYWHLFTKPSSGQDEFGGDNRTDYIDVLYSALYVFQQAVAHGIDPDGRYSQILKDGLAFPALLDPTGSYYYAFLGGEKTFGSQKHPSQLNELLDDPVYNKPSNPARYIYLNRNEITVDASKPFYWGWTLGAFLLAGSRLGLTNEWAADWANMRKSDYVDSEWLQSFETSTHWNMSYYNINNGFIAQSILCNLVDDWYGKLEIGKCNPWKGTQYIRNINSQLGVTVNGTVNGKDYDVTLTAWKDCSFKLYDQDVNLKRGESKRFTGTAPDFSQVNEQKSTASVSQSKLGEVTLSYQPARLGFMDSLEVVVPKGINVTGKNTYVNIIGRGEVLLDNLNKQSVGRHGNKSAINSVGSYSLSKSEEGDIITLRNVDLRPANIPALTLRFTNAALQKDKTYDFKVRYLLSNKYKILDVNHRGDAYAEGNGRWSATENTPFVYGNLNPKVTHAEKSVSEFGIKPGSDCTDQLNAAIEKLSQNGGGTLVFPDGTYNVRTVKLKSHVWLRLSKGTQILMCGKGDAPEATWYKDYSPNAGFGSLDASIYDDADNYLVKQDMGHSFFLNGMFVAERQEDIRILGNGRISGNGWLRSGNGERNDKMFSFKQCRDIEIGGIVNGRDLWYDQKTDEPCYLNARGQQEGDIANMLHVDNGGHFVLLATGSDNVNFHDVYCGKASTKNARDILDFMECRNVTVSNLYSRSNGDDIVKLGSDCSLGFTRKSSQFKVRNIIGDTSCNLFQIGSETADDITDVCVDNLYVLGTNKAGFSISSNDGGTVSRIWFGSGKTGRVRRSQFMRTRTPIFLSVANRGRVIGAEAKPFTYNENGKERHELLVTNIPIGRVENISINRVDAKEIYAGSCFGTERWNSYKGQPESTVIIAGYKLPDDKDVKGGLGFTLPGGDMRRNIENVTINDVNLTFKGGHGAADANSVPPEMGFGKFNIRDFLVQPSWAVWARHVNGLKITNSKISTEKPDGRPAFRFDDAKNCVKTNVVTNNK